MVSLFLELIVKLAPALMEVKNVPYAVEAFCADRETKMRSVEAIFVLFTVTVPAVKVA